MKTAIVILCGLLLTRALCYGDYVSAKHMKSISVSHVRAQVKSNRESVVGKIEESITVAADNGNESTSVDIDRVDGVDEQFIKNEVKKLRRLRYRVTLNSAENGYILTIEWN